MPRAECYLCECAQQYMCVRCHKPICQDHTRIIHRQPICIHCSERQSAQVPKVLWKLILFIVVVILLGTLFGWWLVELIFEFL